MAPELMNVSIRLIGKLKRIADVSKNKVIRMCLIDTVLCICVSQ